MRHAIPALTLFLLAPLVAEFLLGNLPITALPALVLLAPLYGGGALLIREAVRHTGRGWLSILVLALAYGVFEEGVVTMSLFNPNYAGLRLLDNGYVSWLGIGGPWTILVLTLHVVWSISVPIATIEAIFPERRTTPWLGSLGLALTGLAFLIGAVAMTVVSVAQFQFIASAPQLVASGLLAVALVIVGLVVVPRGTATDPAVRAQAPSPWLVAVAAFAASSAFKGLPLDWAPWLYASLALGLALLAMLGVSVWSHRRGWRDLHRLALAAGPLATYAWSAFPQPPVLPASPTVDLVGNAIFAVGTVGLLVLAVVRLRHRPNEASRAARTSQAASRAA